jgi:hypothetical protein
MPARAGLSLAGRLRPREGIGTEFAPQTRDRPMPYLIDLLTRHSENLADFVGREVLPIEESDH